VMSRPRQILVFGFGGIKPVELEYGEMFFVDQDFSHHLAEYDIIIYCVGAFKYYFERGIFGQSVLGTVSAEAIRRENELGQALERGKIVCIVGFDAEDYVVSGLLKSFNVHYGYIHEGEISRNLEVKKSEFKSFVDDVGATQIGFSKDSIDDAICLADQTVVGFSKHVRNGLLLFIPCIWGSTIISYLIEHFEKLVAGLVSYSAKLVAEPPSYVQQFLFTKEKGVREEIDRITKEQIAPLERSLDFYAGLKSVLWLGDKPLVKATESFLRSMGFQTNIDEIFEEDLWIMNGQEKLIIVEVKGLNKNLTRQDISKLDEHKEARAVPNLTGLLIANTFMTADSLESKDQPFPPNVIEKAVNTNLLITRTIDLYRIFDYLELREPMPSQVLQETILGKKGWLMFKDGRIGISC
jgi:hypothetical protein